MRRAGGPKFADQKAAQPRAALLQREAGRAQGGSMIRQAANAEAGEPGKSQVEARNQRRGNQAAKPASRDGEFRNQPQARRRHNRPELRSERLNLFGGQAVQEEMVTIRSQGELWESVAA